ncbi:unnamed protein product [marine sediment metagenome]|uniref:Uncharacterized protein n=1 Tax=marine sediment metagenome TaxID=412755 RepID=X1JQG8_9ZZZZ
MSKIKKKLKVEMAQPLKEKEPKKEPKKEKSKKDLPIWNFPLQGRSVRARTLAEAERIIKAKE